ncbi:MAG: histidine phosphatase family protein [Pseudorhodoplanes sp.]
MARTPPIYILRHGQTDWNAEGRLQGQTDTDINARGRRQADANGRRLSALIGDGAGFDFVASPLRRTRETIERARTAMGLPPLAYRTDPRLMELNYGAWEGSTLPEIEARETGMLARRDRDKWNFLPPGPGGESYAMLRGRVQPWLESVTGPTVCVTHGGVVRVIFVAIEGMPENKAAALEIPQNRVLRLENGRLDWL